MIDRLPALTLADRTQQRAHDGPTMVPVQGVPVVPMPDHVVAAAVRAARHPGPRISRGEPALRRAIAAKLADGFGLAVDADADLLITHGAQHGMSIAMRALLEPGAEVVVPAPTYFFDGMIRLAGAIPRYVATTAANRWQIDVDAIAAAVSAHTRAIVLCNPNNPTGNVPTRECLAEIVALAERFGLLVFADESYERYVHDGPGYVPLMTSNTLSDRLVTVTSLSKNYAFTNWRVGYIHSNPRLIDRINAALEWDAINVGDIPQAAAVAALTGPQDWLEREFATMRQRRDALIAELSTHDVPAVTPDAGVFVFADLSATGRGGGDLEDLLLEIGVPALSGVGFRGPADHARLLYGAALPDVVELGRRVGTARPPARVAH